MDRKLTVASAVGILAAAGVIVAACGSDSTTPASNPNPSASPTSSTITISNFSFAPLDLNVPAGATVTVQNNDSTPHSVTSEAKSGDFTPGAVSGISFDTGAFTGQKTFTIPDTASPGTVIPYYCTVHKAGMATPNGTITIQAASSPDGGTTGDGGTPDGGGPGY